METMSIHRGLAELKLMDSKIKKRIEEISPVGIYQKGKLINQTTTEDEFVKTANSTKDSIVDLMKRKSLIKSAIVKANSTTEIDINGKSMTIAEALNEKALVLIKKEFVQSLKSKKLHFVAQMNKNNEQVEENIQQILVATFGKENVKVGHGDVDSVRKPYMEANEFLLSDPLKVDDLIKKYEDEIEEFESEVDATLSEINAVTQIEI